MVPGPYEFVLTYHNAIHGRDRTIPHIRLLFQLLFDQEEYSPDGCKRQSSQAIPAFACDPHPFPFAEGRRRHP